MNLTDLFDIIYCNESVQEKYRDTINNLKLNSFLYTNTNITNQFVLIISNNIISNKSYNTLKLEFHNITENSINNDIILETLNKLQGIINTTLIDKSEIELNILDESDIETDTEYNILDNEPQDIDANINDPEEELDDTNITLSEKIESSIKNVLQNDEYLQIHVFQKQYENDIKIQYLASFLLNDIIDVSDDLDINNNHFKDLKNIKKLFGLNYYYDTLHKNYNDYDVLYEYIEKYDIIDDYLINNLNKIKSGFYLNFNDIRFQIILKLIVLTYVGDNGNNNKFITYHNFNKNNTLNNYFKYEEENTNIFEKTFIETMHIWCDICNIIISTTPEEVYYHNDIGGDLCDGCYQNKINQFNDRIKYLKTRILKIGSAQVFKKEVIKTRTFLKKIKIKIKKKNYYKLLEKLNKNLLEINSNENLCQICYCSLKSNIYVGSKCGHCFHKECIESCDKCQICRVEGDFIKLFL